MSIIDSLLSFSNDEAVNDLLIASYAKSQEVNEEFSDDFFSRLLFLKSKYPYLEIILDGDIERSHFDPSSMKIYLKEADIGVFFHETVHLFSFEKDKFNISSDFQRFKENFISDNQNIFFIQSLLSIINKEKEKIYDSVLEECKLINEIDNANDKSHNDNCDLILLTFIEDITDSLYDGESYTYGLTYIKDNNTNASKSKKTSGHGCKYFNDTNYQYEEIIANYTTLRLLAPDNKLFVLLKEILGNDFVSFLDEKSDYLIGHYEKDTDLNNINLK